MHYDTSLTHEEAIDRLEQTIKSAKEAHKAARPSSLRTLKKISDTFLFVLALVPLKFGDVVGGIFS